MKESIKKEAAGLLPYMTETRRALHFMPELSSCEFGTSAYIKSRLTELGYNPRFAHTGLMVDIAGTEGGLTIALRADFDALPICEKTGLPFASVNGNMHACGHDGHTSILLGAAKHFAAHPPRRNVRLIFQFGEEGDGGAATMIERGALDGIDEIYAFHLCPELEKGKIGTNDSTLFAGVIEFDVLFSGKSVHCASAADGNDALASAVEFAATLRAEFGNNSKVLVHVGKITGGAARNIVANNAKLECSFRFYEPDDKDEVMRTLRGLINGCDARYGTKGELSIKAEYPPLINDSKCVRKLASITETENMRGRFTAEDFAFYLEHVPGCMAWLGILDNDHDSPLHSDTFDFDESVMAEGAEIFIKLADV